MATFTQALAEARRKAALTGRPLSNQELAGVTAGFAENASERAARSRSLQLQQEQQEETARANRSREAAIRDQMEMELKQAREARAQRTTTATTTGALAGAYYGATYGSETIGPGYGTAIGAVIGFVAGAAENWSLFCSAIQGTFPEKVRHEDMEALYNFRYWVKHHRKKWLMFYDASAPIALSRMSLQGTFKEELEKLHPHLITGVVSHITADDMEGAFDLYRQHVVPVILKYAPEFDTVVELIGDGIGGGEDDAD